MKKNQNINLSKLDRKQKIELYEALQAKKRHKRKKRATYVPNAAQLQVHNSDSITRLVTFGNGAGKTCLAVHEARWAAEGYNPVTEDFYKVPAKVIVVLDKPDKVADVWLKEMNKWFDMSDDQFLKEGKPYVSKILLKNGSEIKFMFVDQDPMTFESIEAQNMIVYDEPPRRNVYISLRRAGRTKGYRTRHLIVGTPIAASWIRREIYEPWARGETPDTDCFRASTEVNKENLADNFIQDFSRTLSDKERRIRLHGEWFDLEGLALAHLFRRDTHIIDPFEWPNNWPVVIAIDPHPNKKHIALMLGADRHGYLYVIKEMASASAPAEFGRELRRFYQGYRVVDIVCDSLGSTPTTGGDGNRSFIDVISDSRNGGNRVRSTTFKEKDDTNFIQKIQQVLEIPKGQDNFGRQLPKLRIFRPCKGIVYDIENVEWLKFKNMDEFKPKLNIGNKDFLATLKYGLATGISFGQSRPKVLRSVPKSSPWGRGV